MTQIAVEVLDLLKTALDRILFLFEERALICVHLK